MTQMATITAKFVNPPKGKGPASIKDAQGTYWKFWTTGKSPIPFETFREGGTYTVGYKTEQYDGKDQYTITAVATDNNPPAAQHQSNGATVSSGNGKYSTTDTATAERIFVCGAINHAIGAGKIDVYTPDEIISAVEALRSAYQATFGKQ